MDYLDANWLKYRELIQYYITNTNTLSNLGIEISSFIERKFKAERIPYANVLTRLKTLKSLCEKLDRKKYDDPISQIEDLVGVRVVFLYTSDRPRIEELIERNFQIIRKEGDSSEADKFGYSALHYIVKLGARFEDDRYNDFKLFKCEIQIRTILQDAWALVSHHLHYKNESSVPSKLTRKLNALAGLFETADDQFLQLRDGIVDYNEKLKDFENDQKKVSKLEINSDTLRMAMRLMMPKRRNVDAATVSDLANELKSYGYNKIGDVIDLIEKGNKPLEEYEEKVLGLTPGFNDAIFAQVGAIRMMLRFINKEYYKKDGSESGLEPFLQFKV